MATISGKQGAPDNERTILEHVETSGAREGSEHHDPDETLKLGQAIKRYPRMVLYCLSLNLVVIGWGYNLVIVGNITGVEPFQDDYGSIYEGQKIIPSIWLSLWQASIPLGMTFGSIFAGAIQDRIGRRYALMTASALCVAGVAVLFFSYLAPTMEGKRGMFFAGKVIEGIAIGSLKISAMTYISESAPTTLRASIMGMFAVSNLIGQFLGSIVVYAVNDVVGKAAYLGAFGSQWLLAGAPFVIAIFLPESPAWLLANNKESRALTSARRLFGARGDPEEAVRRMRITVEEERALTSELSFKTCFTRAHYRRTLIVMGANLYMMLFGLDLLSKSSYFLQILGMDSDISLIILIVGIVIGVGSNAGGVWMLSRFGRRKLILITLSIATLLWLAVGISGSWTSTNVAYFVAAANIAIIIVCGLGVWPAAYAIMGETSSLRLRAKTQALGGVSQQATSVVMSFCLPYVFNPDAGDAGAKTGYLFVGLCLIGIVTTYFLLPEMQGRSMAEIDHMFNMRLPARKFKSWRSEDMDEDLKAP